MRILVTGATGMIGRALVELLVAEGHEVTSTSLDRQSPWPDLPFERADLRDYTHVKKLCRGVEVVVHVAGIKASVALTKSHPATFLAPLLQMNTNVFAAAHEEGVRRVVYTSSIGVYPPGQRISEGDLDWGKAPMDTHPGWAKRMGELHLAAIATERPEFSFAIARPSNVYGPGDNFNPTTAMVIGSLLGRAHRGEDPIAVQGSGEAVRDFVFCGDVAEGLRSLAESDVNGDFNLASGEGVSIRYLASIVESVTETPVHFSSPNADEGFSERVLGIEKARALLNWSPKVNLVDGIALTWSWLRQNGADQVGRVDYFSSK